MEGTKDESEIPVLPGTALFGHCLLTHPMGVINVCGALFTAAGQDSGRIQPAAQRVDFLRLPQASRDSLTGNNEQPTARFPSLSPQLI